MQLLPSGSASQAVTLSVVELRPQSEGVSDKKRTVIGRHCLSFQESLAVVVVVVVYPKEPRQGGVLEGDYLAKNCKPYGEIRSIFRLLEP